MFDYNALVRSLSLFLSFSLSRLLLLYLVYILLRLRLCHVLNMAAKSNRENICWKACVASMR